ncbi:MAG: hypothetical protein OHK0029_00200 [Armatimonadaceae bacterium]
MLPVQKIGSLYRAFLVSGTIFVALGSPNVAHAQIINGGAGQIFSVKKNWWTTAITVTNARPNANIEIWVRRGTNETAVLVVRTDGNGNFSGSFSNLLSGAASIQKTDTVFTVLPNPEGAIGRKGGGKVVSQATPIFPFRVQDDILLAFGGPLPFNGLTSLLQGTGLAEAGFSGTVALASISGPVSGPFNSLTGYDAVSDSVTTTNDLIYTGPALSKGEVVSVLGMFEASGTFNNLYEAPDAFTVATPILGPVTLSTNAMIGTFSSAAPEPATLFLALSALPLLRRRKR